MGQKETKVTQRTLQTFKSEVGIGYVFGTGVMAALFAIAAFFPVHLVLGSVILFVFGKNIAELFNLSHSYIITCILIFSYMAISDFGSHARRAEASVNKEELDAEVDLVQTSIVNRHASERSIDNIKQEYILKQAKIERLINERNEKISSIRIDYDNALKSRENSRYAAERRLLEEFEEYRLSLLSERGVDNLDQAIFEYRSHISGSVASRLNAGLLAETKNSRVKAIIQGLSLPPAPPMPVQAPLPPPVVLPHL